MLYVATPSRLNGGETVSRPAGPAAFGGEPGRAQMHTLLGAGLLTVGWPWRSFSAYPLSSHVPPLKLIADSAMEIGRGNFRRDCRFAALDELTRSPRS